MRHAALRLITVAASVICIDCGGHETITNPTALPANIRGSGQPPIAIPSILPRTLAPPHVFVGAGDIGLCQNGGDPEATARLLDKIDGTVFTLGDNAYPSGTAQDFSGCYDRTWGRHKNRTRPVPGNHEYESPGATPYFDYFGGNAGPHGLGYYSFELGNWHAIALNSHMPVSADSPQGGWLRADLAANTTRCTIAYWHVPRFSSGRHGDQVQMRDFWRLLYEAGADIVMSGHDHTYERFAPQDPQGALDPQRGMRQFVVGTGGANTYQFATVRPNSEMRLSVLGVLKLTLRAEDYEWSFIPVLGPGDTGTGVCH